MVQLIVIFGDDQIDMIQRIIKRLKLDGKILDSKNEPTGNMVKYTIQFKDIYSVYLFGHMQGSQSIL